MSEPGPPLRLRTDAEVAALLPWPELIAAVEAVFTQEGADAPQRAVYRVPRGDRPDGVFLLKPGWIAGEVIAVKAVTFFADNGELGHPTVQSAVLVFDGRTGHLLGACEGDELTARRTAAASVAAAKRLARDDVRHVLIVGAGAVARCLASAWASVREPEVISIWARRPERAESLVTELRGDPALEGIDLRVAHDLDTAVPEADAISSATPATEPLIRGELIAPGTHIDLIGSFDDSMRETDDEVMRRSSIFVDTREDALLAGDIALPIRTGVIGEEDVIADLRDLVAGAHPGRRTDDEITVFKSVGTALEDVAAGSLVFDQ